jgi:hypothetical protein
MAAELGLDAAAVQSDAFLKFFAGNRAVLPGSFETKFPPLRRLLLLPPSQTLNPNPYSCNRRPAMLGYALRAQHHGQGIHGQLPLQNRQRLRRRQGHQVAGCLNAQP